MFKRIFLILRRLDSRSTSRDYQASENVSPIPSTQLCALSADQISELPTAHVKWVVDGDTVIISHGWWRETHIRLDSIDCPEDGQPWGDIAKYALIKMIGGQRVRLEMHGMDVHGRTLGTLYIWSHKKKDWLNVNERMVTLGHAWVMYKYYSHLPQDRRDKLDSLERWARSKKIGLWQTSNPIPPWLWRRDGSS